MRRLKLEKKQHESRAWNDAVVDVGDVNVNRFPVDEESTAMMSPMKKPMNSRELLRKTSQNQQALRSTSVMEVPAHQRHASVGALLATTRRRSASPLGQDMGAALMRSPQQPQSPALPQMNKDTSRSPLAGDVALASLDPALREHLSQLVELVCITKTSSGSERAKPKKI
ncbi:Hypothetical protein, putative [Bodo saltans]|uniref:Uncharacterized protein n=1 Tax=Bodo saltans TaxID=75058 RepID=A0A0S4IRP4_BODSA|nr:Hypothetical protein, putative [Bodo saltans]|eukprot:CUG03268.1 Hypothetical protein, putative [Bodo saltans]